jgi:hypothetical protein
MLLEKWSYWNYLSAFWLYLLYLIGPYFFSKSTSLTSILQILLGFFCHRVEDIVSQTGQNEISYNYKIYILFNCR